MELPDKPNHAAEHKQRIAPAADKAEATLEERREKLDERRHEAEEGDVPWHHLTGPRPEQRERCDAGGGASLLERNRALTARRA